MGKNLLFLNFRCTETLLFTNTIFFLNMNYTLSFIVLHAIFSFVVKECVNDSPDDIPRKRKPDLKKSCSLRSLFDALTVNAHMYALQTISELSTQIT